MTGALDILVVVVAVDLTGGGPAQAAWLGAAFGAGSVLGAAATASAVAVRRPWTVVALSGPCSAVALGLSVRSGARGRPRRRPWWRAARPPRSLSWPPGRCCSGARRGPARCGAFSVVESAESVMLLAGSLAVPLLVTVLGPPVAVSRSSSSCWRRRSPPPARGALAAAGGAAQPAAVRGGRGGT